MKRTISRRTAKEHKSSVHKSQVTCVLVHLCSCALLWCACALVYGETSGEPSSAAPVVIKTSPQTYANDVEPSLKQITVTFDRPMNNSWSWTRGGQAFPKMAAPSSFDEAKTTCTLPVTLEAGKVYWVGINNQSNQNFKNANNVPAKRYVILFATKGSDGSPTPIPENMLQEARAINGSSTAPAPAAVSQQQDAGTAAPIEVKPVVDSTPAATPLPAAEIGLSNEVNAPDIDINDFNSFQRELNRINIDTRSEEQQWLGPLDRKTELVRAIDKLVAAELQFIQKLAESEHAEQTVKAVELVLRQRRDRLNKLTTKLEDTTRQERLEQSPERRPRRTPRVEGEEQSQRRQRRAREPNTVSQ